MSVSRTQQLLALVVGLVAFAGESGASSTCASPAEAGARWLVANENLGARWGGAETLGPLCMAEAIEAFRVPNLRLPTSYYWGASNTLAPKVIAPLVLVRDPGQRGAVNQAPVTSPRPNADETRVSGPAQLARALPSKGRIA